MLELTENQIAEYLYRNYTAVDGLWFVKLEEKYGFDTALELDNEVWKILPKIQARTLKAMGNLGDGIDALFDCLTARLTLENFNYKTEKTENPKGFRITIEKCHWLDLLVKSKREHLAEKISTAICNTDYSVWAAEFGDDIRFELQEQKCAGAEHCILRFSQ